MVNVGVIGCGYWGPNLIRNLVENKQCGGVIACDLDRSRLDYIDRRFPLKGTTTDFQDILEDDSIGAVVVATPLSAHYPLAKLALEAGKHIFVEKPFTARASEARELMDLAEAGNRVITVGHTFLYSPAVQKITSLLREGELGDVYYISSSRVNLGIHQKDVSVLWDLAPHDLSMLFYWLGELPIRVSAVGRDYVQRGIPDVAFLDVTFASGVIAHVEVSWLSPSKLRNTTIVGSRKMLVYDDNQNLEKVKLFDKGVNYKDPETFGEYQLSYRAGDIVSPKLDSYEPLGAEMDDFLTCIREGGRPRADAWSGLQVVRVLEEAEKSLAAHGEPRDLVWDDIPASRGLRV
jgi:predicted dehydrogenase